MGTVTTKEHFGSLTARRKEQPELQPTARPQVLSVNLSQVLASKKKKTNPE